MRTTWMMVAVMCGVWAAASPALSQRGEQAPEGQHQRPERQPGERPPQRQPTAQPQPERDEAIKRELQDRLAVTERQQARIRRAMKLLEEGGSREDLFTLLREIREAAERPQPSRPEEAGRRGPRGEPGRPEGGPGRPGEQPPVELTPEQRTEVLALVREHMPEMYARLERLREQDPNAEDRIIGRFAPMFVEFLTLRENDPTAADLKLREFKAGAAMMRTIGEIRAAKFSPQADPERLRKAVAELRDRVAEQFEIRLAIHEHEISTLRDRLARLERELAEERSQRELLVDQRVERILADVDRRERRER